MYSIEMIDVNCWSFHNPALYIVINNTDTRDNTNITDERKDERSSVGGIVAGVVVSLLVVVVVIAAIILAGVWLWRKYVINSHLFMCV